MKKILFGTLAMCSLTTAFSQDNPYNDSESIGRAMTELTRSHSASIGVQEIVREVEKKYSVKCVGRSFVFFPDITKKVKYSADCEGANKLKLTIESKFKSTNAGQVFKIKNYNIQLL